LQILLDSNILSIPVVDSNNDQFSGVFSITDLLRAIVKGACEVSLVCMPQQSARAFP
jgi:CBS domain-containing protein